ncbi:MAG: S-layer family protein [Verrucomicrobia bacterium]|nr:S-layer family protein [Verrucomicrobiota bacterium]
MATISTSDRAVLQWNATKFAIDAGEVYNFQMPAGGAVLNRVGTSAAVDTATIAGQIDSNGRVFILAPGGMINVHQGAVVTASGGLVLSTLNEDNGAFLTSGNLVLIPSASGNGSISIGIPNPAPGASTAAPIFTSTLTAVGGSLSLASVNASGDVSVRSVTAATPLSLAANGNVRVAGNLAVTATNSDITQGAGGTISVGDTTFMTKLATFTTTGSNNITLDNVGNDFSNISLNTAVGLTPLGAVVVKDVSDVYLSNSTLGGSLAVTAAGYSTSPAIATVGTLSVAGNADFSTTGTITRTGVSISQNSTVGGVLSGTVSNNSSFSFTGLGNVTVGSISAVGGNSTAITVNTTGNVALATGATLSTQGNATTGGGGISLIGTAVNTSAGSITAGNATRAGSVTLNATAGNLTVGSISSNRTITLRAAAGNITQALGSVLSSSTGSLTHVAAALGNIDLSGANTLEGTGVVQLSGASAVLANTNSITLGTTNLTGDLTVNAVGGATNVTLGTGAGTAAQALTIGGNLSINVINGTALVPTANNGNIGDGDYSAVNLFGNLNLVTSGGNILLDAATKNAGLAPSVRYGTVSVSNPTGTVAGTVSIAETTTLNLGNVTASSLTASSAQGGIIDSGNLTVTGAASFNVGGNNSLTLDNLNNRFGSIAVGGNGQAAITANQSVTVSSSITGNLALTTSTGNNITVDSLAVVGGVSLVSGGSLDFNNNAAAAQVSGDLSATAANGALTQNGVGGLIVGGTTSVSAGNATVAASVTLNGANDFNAVVLNNSTGAVTLNDVSNLTLSGTAAGLVTATAGGGSLANTWNLTLGNLTVGSIVATAANGSAGNSGTITQASGTSVNSFGLAKFTTANNNIVLGNAGNNFGRVEVVTNASESRTVTVVEEGTMRLGTLNSRGTSTLTSRTGSIIEDPDANVTVTNNGTLNLNAANGSVLIGGTTTRNGAFTTGGNVVTANISAPSGAAAVQSTGNLTLGNTNVNSLTATTTQNLFQSAALRVFGSASFKATGNITLTNTGNNFGRVSLETTTASRNITITEAGTLNLGTVAMQGGATGSFTATSVSGDIIDTGLANLRIGGTVAAVGSGVVTLNATAGNIVIDDPTTEFATTGGVVFNANNVTLSPLGSVALVLGSAAAPAIATGNLTVTTALPTGNILSAGSVQAGGDASFQAASANIALTGAANKFGTVRFVGQQVSLIESDDTAIVTGSTALQSASISSGGNISLVNRGGIVSFNGVSTTLSASGNITLPKLMQAVGVLTVNAAGTKDLSALSKSADLQGKDPNNSGTGAYLPPGQ